MAFTIAAFQQARPFLFHLTARSNVKRINRTRSLQSAAFLFAASGDGVMIDRKRTDIHEIEVDGEVVSIRDQAPLHKGNIRFQGGWSFADLVRHLNEHVFFWPGSESGPIAYGVRHFERYRDARPASSSVRESRCGKLGSRTAVLQIQFRVAEMLGRTGQRARADYIRRVTKL